MKLRHFDFLSSCKKMNGLGLLAAVILCVSSLSAQGALIGDYRFDGNFNNSASGTGSLSGLTPFAPSGNSDFYSEGGWYWESSGASGLSVEYSATSYSIAIAFEASEFSNTYNKILDFSNRGSDNGLYIYNGEFLLYNSLVSSQGTATINTPIVVIFTRSTEGDVNVYLNGNTVPIISYDDSTNLFGITTSLGFFLDDTTTSAEFVPAGSVSRIMIWDSALSEQEVAETFQAIPEPMTLSLVAGAGALFILQHIRRKRRA